MDIKEIMLNCTKVNHKYMRLPAGKVAGLETMTALYKRIATQSLQCAEAWNKNQACPKHEPAVDAFWWAVLPWADAFGLSVGIDMKEWGEKFILPHWEFARYLKEAHVPDPLPQVDGSPANIIMELDAKWMELVIKLTAEWGLMHHLKDAGARSEAEKLGIELRNPESPTYKAFLDSDLNFFRHLFEPFPFSDGTRQYINAWLKRAEEAL